MTQIQPDWIDNFIEDIKEEFQAHYRHLLEGEKYHQAIREMYKDKILKHMPKASEGKDTSVVYKFCCDCAKYEHEASMKMKESSGKSSIS